jgi:hypothetical protein
MRSATLRKASSNGATTGLVRPIFYTTLDEPSLNQPVTKVAPA